MHYEIDAVVSGGQTGADRAALDWALRERVRHRGWCPAERWAEDGRIPDVYELDETPSADPAQRTEWNVRDSDGTVVMSLGNEVAGGTLATIAFANAWRRPCLHLRSADREPADQLRQFVREHSIRNLNVAGPRASEEPGIGEFVTRVLGGGLRIPLVD